MRRVACVLVRHAGRMLAVTRPNPPLRFGLPGGGVERGETAREGARRELFEETGLVANQLVEVFASPSLNGRSDTHVTIFEALGAEGVLRSSEEGMPVFVKPAVLCDPVFGAYPRFTRALFAQIGQACG